MQNSVKNITSTLDIHRKVMKKICIIECVHKITEIYEIVNIKNNLTEDWYPLLQKVGHQIAVSNF